MRLKKKYRRRLGRALAWPRAKVDDALDYFRYNRAECLVIGGIILALVIIVAVTGYIIAYHSYTDEHTAVITDKHIEEEHVWHSNGKGGGYYTTTTHYYLKFDNGVEKDVGASDYDKYNVGDNYTYTETHWK